MQQVHLVGTFTQDQPIAKATKAQTLGLQKKKLNFLKQKKTTDDKKVHL